MKFKIIGLLFLIFNLSYGVCWAKDFKKDFLDKYERLIDSKTRKEFKKLKTDEEKESFVDKFWEDRDPNPSTPQNEYKQQYDERIANIEKEFLSQDSDLHQFLFRANGGLHGDAAWVYLLLGQPSFKADLLDANYVYDLMIWFYIDTEGGIYRFLFYKDLVGSFRLFENHFGYLEDRLAAVSKFRTDPRDSESMQLILNELRTSINGGFFLDALMEFSPGGKFPHQVLAPPPSTAFMVKSSGAMLIGEYVLSEQKEYFLNRDHSLVPATFRIGNDKDGNVLSYILINTQSIDWQINKDGDKEKAESLFKLRLIFVRESDREMFLFEDGVRVSSSLDWAKEGRVFSILVSKILDISKLPAGNYRVDVYFKNEITGKYNSWIVNYKR